jgi:hypothetical protein
MTTIALTKERQFIVIGARRWHVVRARMGGVHLQRISSDAAKSMKFSLGHPRPGVVYAAHPLRDSYIPLANFHWELFQERVHEAVELLECLGAQSFDVEHVSGQWEGHKKDATINIPNVVQLGAGHDRRSASASCVHYSGSYRPTGSPCVPQHLIWYPYERFWQDLARQRLSRGLSRFELTVEHSESFGVTRQVSVAASRAGLDIGGQFSDCSTLSWRMKGSFTPWTPRVSEPAY